MDCAGIKVEMAEEKLLEPLVITEDGDVTEGAVTRGETSISTGIIENFGKESTLKEEEEHTAEDENEQDKTASKMSFKEQTHTEHGKAQENKQEEIESASDRKNRDDSGGERQTKEVMKSEEKLSNAEVEKGTQNGPHVDVNPTEKPLEEEDLKKAHRPTPDFPEALYELLCTLQEGRRLNDQRCSFRLESRVRRRCHSEPNTTKPSNRVVFSSMTSLQKEEFFELVATTQARRLDDQRAQLERSPLPKPKGRSFRGSIKQLSFVKKPGPVPVPKEDLYNMILTTQAQGRLEDQRSRAPGPMDDEDFFSLLLRVQGGRMDEQRTELPRLLQT
ncbi:G-protein-signaling modulator 1 [Parambassis ranga]|uniref:G-protein-signaling modulator 1 n=1 Tax=Parambassis ranga TaxID=210632 RepID=A0A6P7JYY1_9TELE|nr:G-protein-signaling modulator 1-like [Parambassis ranga]